MNREIEQVLHIVSDSQKDLHFHDSEQVIPSMEDIVSRLNMRHSLSLAVQRGASITRESGSYTPISIHHENQQITRYEVENSSGAILLISNYGLVRTQISLESVELDICLSLLPYGIKIKPESFEKEILTLCAQIEEQLQELFRHHEKVAPLLRRSFIRETIACFAYGDQTNTMYCVCHNNAQSITFRFIEPANSPEEAIALEALGQNIQPYYPYRLRSFKDFLSKLSQDALR